MATEFRHRARAPSGSPGRARGRSGDGSGRGRTSRSNPSSPSQPIQYRVCDTIPSDTLDRRCQGAHSPVTHRRRRPLNRDPHRDQGGWRRGSRPRPCVSSASTPPPCARPPAECPPADPRSRWAIEPEWRVVGSAIRSTREPTATRAGSRHPEESIVEADDSLGPWVFPGQRQRHAEVPPMNHPGSSTQAAQDRDSPPPAPLEIDILGALGIAEDHHRTGPRGHQRRTPSPSRPIQQIGLEGEIVARRPLGSVDFELHGRRFRRRVLNAASLTCSSGRNGSCRGNPGEQSAAPGAGQGVQHPLHHADDAQPAPAAAARRAVRRRRPRQSPPGEARGRGPNGCTHAGEVLRPVR